MHDACSPEISPSDHDSAISRQRRTLRENALAARDALSPAQLESHTEAICVRLDQSFPQLASQRVAFCWPIRQEPDLRPLITRWIEAAHPDFRALLPVVDGPKRPLFFRRWTPDCDLQEDRYGIPTPIRGEVIAPDTLLIPVNAFDAQGYRLGYGGGFFDRTLASLRPRPFAIGIGFELARVDTIHPQAHDMRLDAIVTEAGVFRTS